MDKLLHKSYNYPNLELILPLLSEHNIEYFLHYGTLLGAVREGDLLEMDDDIDIGINVRDRDKLLQILPEHFPSFQVGEWPNESPYFLQSCREIGDEKTYIDFYLYDSDINENYIIDRWNYYGRWAEPNYHVMIPKDIIYPIEQKTFRWGESAMPAKAVETVEYLFGDRWMHPARKIIDYTTLIENGKPVIVYK